MCEAFLFDDNLFVNSDIGRRADHYLILNEDLAHFIEVTLSSAPTLPDYWIYKSQGRIMAAGVPN